MQTCMLRRIVAARGRGVPLGARLYKALEHYALIMSEWSGLINNVARVKRGGL